MDINMVFVIALFFAIVFLFFWLVQKIVKEYAEFNKLQAELEQKLLVKAKQDLKELDEALSEWLVQLNLPQFAEKMKRQEAARQLRTVLIEKLMRQKVPD